MHQGDTINVCRGSSLNYVSNSTGYTTINWFFHLGTPNTAATPNAGPIVYNTNGFDSTIQIISDGVNVQSFFIFIKVTDIKPAIDFTSDNNVCSGIPVQFNSTVSSGVPPYTYSWSFGGGGTSNIANPLHSFTSLGCGTATFNNTLTVTDATGCSSTIITHAVSIKQAPDVKLADQDQISPFSNCENSPSPGNATFPITINNVSPSAACITSYSINWGDGGGTIPNVSFPLNHTYTQVGAFNLMVTAVGQNGCTHDTTYVVANQTNPAGSLGTLGSTTNLCAPAIVPFTISNWQINSVGTVYVLSFGDGQQVVLNHPLNPGLTTDTIYHTYTTSSCPNPSYVATLTVSNACGSTPYTAGNIQVRIKPTAAFTIAPNPGCINSSICFSNNSILGSGINCSSTPTGTWNYGDGTIVNNPVSSCHSYTTPGTYNVTLTLNNFCGTDSIVHQVCIRNPPQASFTMSAKTSCDNGTVTLTNTSPVATCGGDAYLWTVTYSNPQNCGVGGGTATFINGTTAASTNPQIQFSGPGVYVITLRTSAATASALSCSPAFFRDTFLVKAKPKIISLTLVPGVICVNNSMQPTAVITSCYDTTTLIYEWLFTSGTPAISTLLNPGPVFYNSTGSFPVQFSVTNSCGTTVDNSKAVLVGGPPTANAGPDKEICSGDPSITIGTTGAGGVTYQWSPATGLSNPNIPIPTVTLIYTGPFADTTYQYVITASSGSNCLTRDTVLVKVKAKPVVTVLPVSAALCIGDSITLSASGATTYSWTPTATLNPATGTPVIAKPIVSTNYIVTGFTNGCSATAQASITVNNYPATNAGPDTTVCNNTATVQLTGTPAGGTWSGPNVTSGGLFNPLAAGNGTYTLYYTVTSNSCSKKDSILATVINPPIANAGNDSTVCQSTIPFNLIGLPAGGTWSGSPSITPGGQLTASTASIYQLIYTIGSGSCISKDTVLITASSNISNNTIASNQQICINTQPSQITGQTATGGNGPASYQWQSSPDNITWTIIPGATGLNYSPPVLTTTTYYRRIANTTLCAGVQGSNSNAITITVKFDAHALFTATDTIKCAPYILGNSITVTPFPDRNGTYNWYANGVLFGSNTTGIFPGYTILAAGQNVIIKLVVTSAFGCKSDSMQKTFVTVQSVTAGFTKNKTAGCDTLKVTFVNTSTILNNTIQYFWNFGNGILSTAIQPGTINYLSSPNHVDTTYYITLKAFNGCDTSRMFDSVKIRANPKARFGVDTTFGCSPFTAHFVNTSLGGPSTYYWDFDDGTRDTMFTLTSFNHVYHVAVTDTFRVRLIAVNECKSDTAYVNIVVAPNTIHPQISVNGNQLFGCAPQNIVFNNASTGATSFTWNFGDGSPVVVTSPQQTAVPHLYTNPGVFPVSVRIQNGCSDTTVFLQVEIFAKPIADFTSNATSVCAGDTVRFTNISVNANAYRWNFGDGNSSILQNPTHVYATGGTYVVTLFADKVIPQGIVCSDNKTASITVTSKPAAIISSNAAGQHCQPFTFIASAVGIGNETVAWYITDTTVIPSVILINGINAQYIFNKSGTFSAKLVVTNSAGCTDSATVSFVVKNKPNAAFAPLNVSTCKNDTTILHINNSTYTGIDPLQYRWLVDNSLVATTSNLTHQYLLGAAPLPRTFNTWLIVSNTLGCSDTAKGTVVMQQPAKAGFNIVNPNTCVPFDLQINNTSIAALSYKWLLNGTQVSTSLTPTFTITQPSTLYTISLIVDNSFGCKPDTLTRTFTTLARPKALFTVSDTLGCSGSLNVAMNNQSTGATGYTWIWSDGSPNSAFTNPTHLFTNLGDFPIILIAKDGTCNDTLTVHVRIANKPVANFSANITSSCGATNVTFTNLSTLSSSYLWDFGDGTFSTATNPSRIFPARATAYTIKLVATGTFGCKDSLVKPNLILAKPLPGASFVVSPSNIIAVPNYSFGFINTTPQNNSYSFLWQFGDNGLPVTTRDASHRYLDTGRYLVSLAVFDNVSNCTDTAFQFVRITGFPGYLYVPNAFQPGSLQPILKTFLPMGTGLATYRLQIFTTWGQKIFETTSLDAKGAPNQGWNGLYNGTDNFNQGRGVQQDVYIWRIDAVFKDGTEWKGMSYPNQAQEKRVGTITLVR